MGKGEVREAVRVADAEQGRGARLGRGCVCTSPNPLPQFSLCSFGPRTPQRYRPLRLRALQTPVQYIQASLIIEFCSSPGPAHRLTVCRCLIDPAATPVLRRRQPDVSPFANTLSDTLSAQTDSYSSAVHVLRGRPLVARYEPHTMPRRSAPVCSPQIDMYQCREIP